MPTPGGMGLLRGYPFERLYRDVRYYGLEEGSSEIQRMLIAKELLKRSERGNRHSA